MKRCRGKCEKGKEKKYNRRGEKTIERKKDNRSVKTVEKEIQSAGRQRQRDTATQAELLLNEHIPARVGTQGLTTSGRTIVYKLPLPAALAQHGAAQGSAGPAWELPPWQCGFDRLL